MKIILRTTSINFTLISKTHFLINVFKALKLFREILIRMFNRKKMETEAI